MARVSTFVGSFARRTGTGTQAVTGVGFTPKALIFWSSDRTAATGMEAADQRLMFGLSDGTHHAASSHVSQTGVADVASGYRNDSAFVIVDLDNSVNSLATVQSLDSDGFTLNWSAATSHDGILINVLAVGGTEPHALVGDFAASGTTGHQSVTGIGFAPACVILLPSIRATTGNYAGGGWGPASLGWFTAGAQGASSTDTNAAGRQRYQRTDRCIAARGLAGNVFEAEKVSLDSDGFTINWTTGHAGRVAYLALSGLFAEAASMQCPGTNSTSTLTTTGLPSAVLLLSGGNGPDTTVNAADEFAIGALDSAGNQRTAWSCQRPDSLNCGRYQSASVAIISASPPAGTVTTLQTSAVGAMQTHGFTLDWTVVDGNQEEVIYLMLGDFVQVPLDYEDPCTIEKPVMFVNLNTGTEVVKVSIKGLRDTAAQGGYAEPRLLTMGPITRASSDPATGAFPAQQVTMTWADTDKETRARSTTRFGYRNSTAEVYLTSLAQRQAAGPPRLLMAGKVRSNDHSPFLAESFNINDLISVDYSLFAEEKLIPQRQIDRNWFPTAPVASIGLGEPIIGGTRAPLSPDNASTDTSRHEGIVPGIFVGRVTIGGTPGTPTGTTLAAVVAALNASGAGGTLYTDYGGRIGFSDAIVLQSYYDSHGTVPADYDGLAAIIGFGDLDAMLAGGAVSGGTEYVVVVLAGHAIKAILNGGNGDPSIWIDDTQISAAQIGVSVFIDTSRDILGADGTTRRYAILRFTTGSTYGDQVEAGGRVHVDCTGLEDVGDGSGTLIEDAFSLYQHLLINFILQDYQSGAWLTTPTFLFSDGVTSLDRVSTSSFAVASAVAQLQIPQGRLGSFTISTRTANRDIITKCNQSWGCLLAQDDYQRLFIKVLDSRRTEFYTNASGNVHRVLRDKIDFLPGFWMEAKPDWQVNYLRYEYAKNDVSGSFERASGGGGDDMAVKYQAGIDRDGLIEKLLTLDFVRDDLTALVVAGNYRDLFANLPYVAHYARRGLCSLEDDVLDGVPITHFNFSVVNGTAGDAFWVLDKTYTNYHCEYQALYVEPLIAAIEAAAVAETDLVSDPVALEDLIADDDAAFLVADG